MHEQCLFEFENEVRYERDHNGDDDEPKYYCPNHHPHREELLSEDVSDRFITFVLLSGSHLWALRSQLFPPTAVITIQFIQQ